jgi:hypothetical protein
MQFLALIESIAGVLTPTNLSDVIALVEKLVTLGEQTVEAAKASQQPPAA